MAELPKVAHLRVEPRPPDLQVTVLPTVNTITSCQLHMAEWELQKFGKPGVSLQLPCGFPSRTLNIRVRYQTRGTPKEG